MFEKLIYLIPGQKKRAFCEKKARLLRRIAQLKVSDFDITVSSVTSSVPLYLDEVKRIIAGSMSCMGVRTGAITMRSNGSRKYTLELPRTSHIKSRSNDILRNFNNPRHCTMTEEQYNTFVNTVTGCDSIETIASVIHIRLNDKYLLSEYDELRKLTYRVPLRVYPEECRAEKYSIQGVIETKPFTEEDYPKLINAIKAYFADTVKMTEYHRPSVFDEDDSIFG